MSLSKTLLAEFKQESANTRKLLAVVPFEKGSFKPHEKSMTLHKLTNHIAEISKFWNACLLHKELDFVKGTFVRANNNSTEELLAYFDNIIEEVEKTLSKMEESEFAKTWTLKRGDHIIFTLPKAVAIRNLCMNHLIHHRGQLTVYLRLLNVPIPGMYGPSADES